MHFATTCTITHIEDILPLHYALNIQCLRSDGYEEVVILYTWLFLQWFYFHEFCESDLVKISMSIFYSNENIRKIVKLSPHKIPHLVQICENTCTRKSWRTYSTHTHWHGPPNVDSRHFFSDLGTLVSSMDTHLKISWDTLVCMCKC